MTLPFLVARSRCSRPLVAQAVASLRAGLAICWSSGAPLHLALTALRSGPGSDRARPRTRCCGFDVLGLALPVGHQRALSGSIALHAYRTCWSGHARRTRPRRIASSRACSAFLSAMTLVTARSNLALHVGGGRGNDARERAARSISTSGAGALEATWKYLLICSVGIALALLGTFFLGIAASGSPRERRGLTLSAMTQAAPCDGARVAQGRVRPGARRLRHQDGAGAPSYVAARHAQPGAVAGVRSALGSALELRVSRRSCASTRCASPPGNPRSRRRCCCCSASSRWAWRAPFIGTSGDYKRLFAYSSIENMGIMAVGVGTGRRRELRAMFHAVNHSLCKAGLFFLAGNVLRAYGTTTARDVRGVFRRLAADRRALMAALLLAIGGAPPFGPFWSEFMIFQSAMRRPASRGWACSSSRLLAIAFLGHGGRAVARCCRGLPPSSGRAPQRAGAVGATAAGHGVRNAPRPGHLTFRRALDACPARGGVTAGRMTNTVCPRRLGRQSSMNDVPITWCSNGTAVRSPMSARPPDLRSKVMRRPVRTGWPTGRAVRPAPAGVARRSANSSPSSPRDAGGRLGPVAHAGPAGRRLPGAVP